MHVISKQQTGGRKMLKTHIEQRKVGERNTKQRKNDWIFQEMKRSGQIIVTAFFSSSYSSHCHQMEELYHCADESFI